jgi:hypothetical protein
MKVTNKNRGRKRIRKLEPVGSRISRRKLKNNKEDGRTGHPRRGNSNRVQLYLHLREIIDARGEEEDENIGLNINAIVYLKRKQKTRKNQGKQVKVVPFGE